MSGTTLLAYSWQINSNEVNGAPEGGFITEWKTLNPLSYIQKEYVLRVILD